MTLGCVFTIGGFIGRKTSKLSQVKIRQNSILDHVDAKRRAIIPIIFRNTAKFQFLTRN